MYWCVLGCDAVCLQAIAKARFTVVFLSTYRPMGRLPSSGHDRLLPNTLQFITHWPAYHSMVHRLDTAARRSVCLRCHWDGTGLLTKCGWSEGPADWLLNSKSFNVFVGPIGLSVPHRKHITSPLQSPPVNKIYRFVWPRDTPLSTKVGTKFLRQVAVAQLV
jgi:hypothetical protein